MNRRDRLEWAKVTWDTGPDAWKSRWDWIRAILHDVWYGLTGNYPKYMRFRNYVGINSKK